MLEMVADTWPMILISTWRARMARTISSSRYNRRIGWVMERMFGGARSVLLKDARRGEPQPPASFNNQGSIRSSISFGDNNL